MASIIELISSFVKDSFLDSFSCNIFCNFLESLNAKKNADINLIKNRVNVPQNNCQNETGESLLANSSNSSCKFN